MTEIKKHVLVTGAGGQLASELEAIHHQCSHLTFDFVSRTELDISNIEQVRSFLDGKQYDYCINTAAYTKVDLAETDQAACYAVNVDGVRHLLDHLSNTVFIHISSDYVYHNDVRRPLLETDPTTPKGVYARSKLDGEAIVLDHSKRHIVLRTSWVFSPYGHNFVNTILRLLKTRDELRIINDQIGRPTYAYDLARIMLVLIDKNPTLHGVYNVANKGQCSWYDFAVEIARQVGSDTKIDPISTAEYPTAADRPAYSVLSTDNIERALGVNVADWKERLEHCLKRMVKP